PERWAWDATLGRYGNLDTGRLLPAARIQAMRDGLIDSAMLLFGSLAERLSSGKHDVGSWERAMRDAIKAIFGAQYVFGRGGFKAMQGDDWEHLGELVEQQFDFLSGFADDVAAGKL